jgi:hypothetical protein
MILADRWVLFTARTSARPTTKFNSKLGCACKLTENMPEKFKFSVTSSLTSASQGLHFYGFSFFLAFVIAFWHLNGCHIDFVANLTHAILVKIPLS